MGDGGYIFDEELSPEFLELQKYDFFRQLGSDDSAFKLTLSSFRIDKETLMKIIEKYGGEIRRKKIPLTWNGYCPESAFKNEQVRMRLNRDDFYESEATGLQIAVLQGSQAIILNFRGSGEFRSTASFADVVNSGELLSPQNYSSFPFNKPTKVFEKSEEIEEYIKLIPVLKVVRDFIDKPLVGDEAITNLLLQKVEIENKIETVLQQKGFKHFSSKKFVGDLGEYYAKLNLEHFFEPNNLKISDVSNAPYDISGRLKIEFARRWNMDQDVRIEVKTRFHQIGRPHLFGLNKDNFDLLVFVSLNSDYSPHFIGVSKAIDLPELDRQNRIVFSNAIKLVYPEQRRFVEHIK